MPIVARQRLTRPNAFALPGDSPGFNPAHIAALRPRFSGVALGGSFVNLLNGANGVKVGSPVANVSEIGAGVAFGSANTDALTFGGQSTTNDLIGTFGAIYRRSGTSANAEYLFSTSNAASTGLGFGPGAATAGDHKLSLAVRGQTSKTSNVILAQNTPYFVCASWGSAIAANTTVWNFAILNLSTGQLQTLTATDAFNVTPGVPNGTYVVGNSVSANTSADGNLAAVMFSASYLTLPQLVQWTQAPWNFWYP